MKITLYRLHDQAVELRPWDTETPVGARSSRPEQPPGWALLCPAAFEATWNGGSRPEDVEIRFEGTDADPADFVQSNLGEGRLTFYPGYQAKVEGEHALCVRGPTQTTKQGLAAQEQTLDASLLPCTVIAHWQFTCAHQTIRFEAGEPFALLVPCSPSEQTHATWEVIQPQEDDVAYQQAFQQMVDSPAMHDVFARLGVTPAAASATNAQPAPQTWAAQLADPPPVSCICPTYGRVELLEEAIYCFLQQDYPGAKELIVLNDYERQTLEFDHPEVRVVNQPERFGSVGTKYEAAVDLAAHDLIFVWHDDDIYLPHRLSYSVAHCGPNTAFFKADKAWFWNDGQLSGPGQNVFHGGSCWRRDLYRQVHGYPHIGNGYDVEFESRCQGHDPDAFQVDATQPADVYTLYRWNGTGSYHLSAMNAHPPHGAGQENQNVAAYVEQQAARGQIPQGQIRLQPGWKSDYSALARDALATLPAPKEDA
jgi:hypothetical protein